MPRGKGESEGNWEFRVRKTAIPKLEAFYQALGYRKLKGQVMGLRVEPKATDPADQLLDEPNPPPLAANGDTPSSRLSRASEQDPELADLEASGNFIRFS